MLTVSRRVLLGSGLGAVLAGPELVRAQGRTGQVFGNPEAAVVGNRVLAQGGTAADALFAAALMAAVVSIHNCGFAGYGGTATIARGDGTPPECLDFNSTAPAAARPDMYSLLPSGAVEGGSNTFGWLAVGVPGIPAGLDQFHHRYCTRSMAELAAPAIRAALDGFRMSEAPARAIQAGMKRIAVDPGAAAVLLPSGRPPVVGETYRNPRLGELLTTLVSRGSLQGFYEGEIASRIAAEFKKRGGLVTSADLAAYRALTPKPSTAALNGFVIHTPPPTAGGATVLQALLAMREIELRQKWDSGQHAHAKLEALRVAWGDRLRTIGDPAFVNIPLGRLLSSEYAETTALKVIAAVQNRARLAVETDGRPAGGTVNLSAVDKTGTVAALTLTHGGGFGAQVGMSEFGLIFGHGMSRFDPRPSHPNSPGPGKRPLHNMCPTVVTRGGKPVLAIGGAGGRKIVNGVFDVLYHVLRKPEDLVGALAAPRMHTEGGLDLWLDSKWEDETAGYLVDLGYAVKRSAMANISAAQPADAQPR